MSTVTNTAAASLRDIGKATTAATRLGQQLITGKKVDKPQDGPSTWLQASRAQSAAGYLDAIHTGLTELATNIRVVDTNMQAIGRLLGIMQGQLEQAQKYPAGDPVRQQLISGANGSRKQIDDLVNTTAQDGARNLMTDPAKNPSAGPIQALVGLDGQLKTVHPQVVDSGSAGLDIPVLSIKATDAQIQAQLETVHSAQTTLDARRNGLAADASAITRYTTQSSSISDFYQGQAESLTGVDETEAALELQSVSTQQSLALQSLVSINTSRDAILELLR
jgi:flagellin-like hook-associated protein FlgL